MRCAYVRHLWDCGETIEIEEKHRTVWSQRTETGEEKEGFSGRYQKAEQVETRAGPEKTDQVEFRKV